MTYAPSAIGTMLVEKIRNLSETFVKANAAHVAATSTDKDAVLASLIETSDAPEAVKARKAHADYLAAKSAAEKVLAASLAETTLSEKDLAILALQVKETRKEITANVSAGETVEPGFAEYVATLDIPGVKRAGTPGTGTGGIKPRVTVSVNGVEILDPTTKRSSFTAASRFISDATDTKVAVVDLQQAWIVASGKSDAKDILDPVSFDFAGQTILVTKNASK